ncbi:MAG TPA: class I SAM-dependent methyltransferase [Anaerolineales bacterium]
MDNIIKTNRERWNALARANVEYSQPFLDFTREQAAEYIYRHGVLKDLNGKNVLCLASGGGQDSVAFGLLGADVTMLDLSDVQLERDRQAAEHHGLNIKTVQGDMRDLSTFSDNHFNIVWQVYSINFIPSVESVFREVWRVLKPSGVYFLQFANPFAIGIDEEKWDGKAYPLNSLYIEGEDLSERFPQWDVVQPGGTSVKRDSPHEFRHTLGTVLNTMAGNGFVLLGLWEWMRPDEEPQAGSWAHFTQVIPPYLSTFWRLEK